MNLEIFRHSREILALIDRVKPLNDPLYALLTDRWSCGCVFGELLKNHVLLPGRSTNHQLQVIFMVLINIARLSFVPESISHNTIISVSMIILESF